MIGFSLLAVAMQPGTGGLAGATEVTLQQPTVTAKNFLQQGKTVPLDPRILYRGWFVNCVSIAPINAMQFGANRQIEAWLKKFGPHPS